MVVKVKKWLIVLLTFSLVVSLLAPGTTLASGSLQTAANQVEADETGEAGVVAETDARQDGEQGTGNKESGSKEKATQDEKGAEVEKGAKEKQTDQVDKGKQADGGQAVKKAGSKEASSNSKTESSLQEEGPSSEDEFDEPVQEQAAGQEENVETPARVMAATASFKASDRYFIVTEEALPVYVKSGSGLVQVGLLLQDQVYPRVRDYGNWHEITWGDRLAYVRKAGTAPHSGQGLKNVSQSQPASARALTAKVDLPVYDNTSGRLIPYATVLKGQAIGMIREYGPNWYQVEAAGRIGYVAKRDVTVAFQAKDRYFQVVGKEIPVYDNSTGRLVEIGTLKPNEIYVRVRDYGNWHEIQFGAQLAYVRKADTVPVSSRPKSENRGQYGTATRTVTATKDLEVYDNSTGKLVPYATLKAGKRLKAFGNYGANWIRVEAAGRIGYVRSSEAQLSFMTGDRYFQAARDGVMVYSKGPDGLVPVVELVKGQVYPRVRDYGNWHEVRLGSGLGYVRKSETQPVVGASVKNLNNNRYKPSKTYVTSVDAVEVYDNSSGRLVPYAKLLPGKTYPVVGSYGSNWYRVLVADRVGYVRKKEVRVGEWKYVASAQLAVYRSFDELADYRKHLTFYNPNYKRYYTLTMGDYVQVLEQHRYATKIRTTNNVEGWVHTEYLVDQLNNVWWRVKEERTLRSGPGTRFASLGTVPAGSKVKVLAYQLGQDNQYKHWYQIETASGQRGWIWGAQNSNNTGANIVRYEFEKEGKVVDYITPFTPLNTKSSATAQQINRFIDSNTTGKTIMTGMGAAFIKAGQLTGLNPIYLMAHAAHETGWGRSVIVRDKYNFYGIGAIDSNPYEGAYGYDNPEDGIIAGAMWIKRNYIDHPTYQQKTLDNMRNNNQSHQYATDEAWHVKIVEIAQRFFRFIKGN